MDTCYLYLRVSTEEQAAEGFSLDNQQRACEEYAKNNNFEVVKIFREEGRSARTIDRPAFKELMDEVKINPPSAVIFYKIDRLARNIADFANLRKEFKKYGN